MINLITLQIIYIEGYTDFDNARNCLKDAQKITSTVMNYTVNRRIDIENLSKLSGLTEKEYAKREYNKSVDGAIYSELVKDNNYNILLSNSLAAAKQFASKCYSNNRSDVRKGNRTRETYKKCQPIFIPKQSLKVYEADGEFYLKFSPYTPNHKKEIGIKPSEQIVFKIKSPGFKNKEIMRKCLSDNFPDFNFCESKIKSKGKGKKEKWYLLLTYSFPAESLEDKDIYLDKEKYLGVDLGVVNPICASIYGDKESNTLIIPGEHIIGHVRKTEKRKRELQREIAYCGEGKIGHGTAKRFEAVTKLKGKIANYRDTENKKMARQVVDYAIKYGCGTIQMEDLSGIKSNKKGKFLSDWVYYNLQLAIEHAAKKVGIDVVYVKPRYTSQRCSKCGAIHKESRKSQSEFICVECGFIANADFNASQNLAIPFIDEIIEEVKPSKKYKKVG